MEDYISIHQEANSTDSQVAITVQSLGQWLEKHLESERSVSESDLVEAFREFGQQLPERFARHKVYGPLSYFDRREVDWDRPVKAQVDYAISSLESWFDLHLKNHTLVSESDLVEAFREFGQQLPERFASSSKCEFPSSHNRLRDMEALEHHLRQYFKVTWEQRFKPFSLMLHVTLDEMVQHEIKRGKRTQDGHRVNCLRDHSYSNAWLVTHRFGVYRLSNIRECDCAVFDWLQEAILEQNEISLDKSLSRAGF